MEHTRRGDWPALTLADWAETRDTLHLWLQIVGKVRLALSPMVNHWWQVTLYVSARGLTTSLMYAPGGPVEMELDFIDHDLVVRSGAGDERRVALQPRTVADFYTATMRALDALGTPVTILTKPQEVLDAIPFDQDTVHASYDPIAAHLFWRQLVNANRVMTAFRARFIGKASPVHFFWGGPDLAVTRFSGRPAPKHPGGVPNCADWVQELAYSHEVSSCGFWPSGSSEGSFYSYAYPAPDGFSEHIVLPDAAYYDPTLGEFLLPYADVRTAEDPDALLLEFFQSTYDAAADLAGWPRSELEA
jgi:hypothetical protein